MCRGARAAPPSPPRCAWANRERVANSWGRCGLSPLLTPRGACGERRLISKRRAASAGARLENRERAPRIGLAGFHGDLAESALPGRFLLNLPCRGRFLLNLLCRDRFLLNLLRRIGPFPHPHSGAPRRPPFC